MELSALGGVVDKIEETGVGEGDVDGEKDLATVVLGVVVVGIAMVKGVVWGWGGGRDRVGVIVLKLC